jgi:hypothetical protein
LLAFGSAEGLNQGTGAGQSSGGRAGGLSAAGETTPNHMEDQAIREW